MDRFWIDTSCLITAENSVLSFDISPGFWEILELEVVDGRVRSSVVVFEEIVRWKRGSGRLIDWAKKMNERGMFLHPSQEVTREYQQIADYIVNNCDEAEGKKFLRDADGWLIAHAKHAITKTDQSMVVTQEILVGVNSRKVKIPNICDHFGVDYVNTEEMLRKMGRQLKR